MAIQWTQVASIFLVLAGTALVAWEAAGLDGDLPLLPSDILHAVRVSCVEWAEWLGSCVCAAARWVYDNILWVFHGDNHAVVRLVYDKIWWMLQRIIRAVVNLIGVSCGFLEVPYAFVCTALCYADEWTEVVIPPWLVIPSFFVAFTLLIMAISYTLGAAFSAIIDRDARTITE
jgi:hypothetical protein